MEDVLIEPASMEIRALLKVTVAELLANCYCWSESVGKAAFVEGLEPT